MKTTPLKAIAVSLLFVSVVSCSKENLSKPTSAVSAVNESALANDSIFIGAKYGGGIIFWIDATGLHGLIAAENNASDTAQWSPKASVVTGATKKIIGTGPANTRKIIDALGTSHNYAALICSQFRAKGFNDWFLPSIDELKQLMAQKDLVGGFDPNNLSLYASSTEAKTHTTQAYGISYQNSANVSLGNKEAPFNVRPVRKF